MQYREEVMETQYFHTTDNLLFWFSASSQQEVVKYQSIQNQEVLWHHSTLDSETSSYLVPLEAAVAVKKIARPGVSADRQSIGSYPGFKRAAQTVIISTARKHTECAILTSGTAMLLESHSMHETADPAIATTTERANESKSPVTGGTTRRIW